MKIICEKGYHAGNVLRLVAEYLEKRYPDDMILDENMEITLSLKNGVSFVALNYISLGFM